MADVHAPPSRSVPAARTLPTPSKTAATLCGRLRRVTLLEAGALAALLLVALARSLATTELYFYDETAYLARGLRAEADFINGATYSDLYWLVGQVVPEPVHLYFVVRAVAAAALVFGVWLAARLLAQPWLAWVSGAVIAASTAPYLWPSVAAPAAACIIVGIAILYRWPGLISIGAAAALFWCAAGARPEYVWWASFVSVLALILVLRRAASAPRAVPRLDVFVALMGAWVTPAILFALHGSPLGGSGRGWAAFGQHFALRNALEDENPWLDWERIAARHFGAARSVTEAFLASPDAVVGHIASNVAETPTVFLEDVLGGPEKMAGSSVSWAMMIILVAGVAMSLVTDIRATRHRAVRLARLSVSGAYTIPTAVLISLLLAVAIPLAVVYPRGHYLVLPAGLAVVFVVVVQERVGSHLMTWLVPVTATVIAFAFLVVQTAGLGSRRLEQPPARAWAVETMADSDVSWRLLGSDWGTYGLDVYVEDLEQISPTPLPTETFSDFLVRNGVNAVLLNETLVQGPLGSTAEFERFSTEPRAFGFFELVPDSDIWVQSAARN